jgi:hypothetical protein
MSLNNPITEPQVPQAIARDTEVMAAINIHTNNAEPHGSTYLNQSRGDARYRQRATTAFFQGGVQELGPYASCQSSGSSIAAAYSNSQANNFTFGLHVQSLPWSGAAYMAFHRPGSVISFLGLDSDNLLKWGGGNTFPVWRVWTEGYGVPVWQTPSDRQLKTNIAPIKSALELLVQAKPVSFEYRPSIGQWSESRYQRKKLHYGFLADEFPIEDLVSLKDNGFLGIDYLEIIPFLVRALQEENAQVVKLEAQVVKLESKILAALNLKSELLNSAS